jgi:selenocysteine lyase/cysteine desulfurase
MKVLIHLIIWLEILMCLISGPYVEIDMRSGEMDGYDAIFLSPHKFLGGPGSPGILLMSKALYLLKSSPPSTCGGGTVNYVNSFNEKVNCQKVSSKKC